MAKENKNQIFNRVEPTKQEIVSITYEEIGFFPRSFSRVLDRFLKQVFSDVENLVIQEYRFYRYLFLTTLKCLLILFFVPFLVNFFAKTYLVRPLAEYFWNTQQTEIFLNSYQQKRAFSELKNFEEKLYFESLIIPASSSPWPSVFSKEAKKQPDGKAISSESAFFEEKQTGAKISSSSLWPSADRAKADSFLSPFSDCDGICQEQRQSEKELVGVDPVFLRKTEGTEKGSFSLFSSPLPSRPKAIGKKEDKKKAESAFFKEKQTKAIGTEESKVQVSSIDHLVLEETALQKGLTSNQFRNKTLDLDKVRKENSKRDAFEQRLQEKTIELAIRYNNQSIEAVTNFFADLLSFITLCYLLFALEIQINITKSFLLEVFFGLDDSKKSLLILLITDLLVGYHSSNLWELFFEFLFNHYGLPESQTGIFLLVATLPVLLDVLFKYLIFRHLNRSSPATVATYHAMIE